MITERESVKINLVPVIGELLSVGSVITQGHGYDSPTRLPGTPDSKDAVKTARSGKSTPLRNRCHPAGPPCTLSRRPISARCTDSVAYRFGCGGRPPPEGCLLT